MAAPKRTTATTGARRRSTRPPGPTRPGKGALLEHAVRLVEEHILRQAPAAKDAELEIVPNKTIVVDGVRSEVDLWIRMRSAGHGYESIFIFECKNRGRVVSKRDIVDFADLINETSAQRGFFVAPRFGRDALRRAKREPRMEIVRATVTEFTALTQLQHSTATDPVAVTYDVQVHAEPLPEYPERAVVPRASDSPFACPGFNGPLQDYVQQWAAEEDAKLAQPVGAGKPFGRYQATAKFARQFEAGTARLDGVGIRVIELTVVRVVDVLPIMVRATVATEGRGGTLHMYTVRSSGEEIAIALVHGAAVS